MTRRAKAPPGTSGSAGRLRPAVAPASRDTRQKRAIRRAIEHAGRPLSPDEIREAALAHSRGLGMATVYRSVKALLDERWLSPVDVPGRPVLYERSGKSHHHHFLCDACDRVYELDGCEISAPLPRGFRARDHDVTIYGTCKTCSSPERRRSVAQPTRSGR